ncbi:hypothetical protein [Mitsuokella sp.]|uniref:Y-family DNA polymerase n=1 Tax=Mitsuokella sp. TaxID=2049034 RepID=UPI003F737162
MPTYLAIDLKSFYASVECRERNLNPLTTNLVVADPTRTAKTICLAVSPSLKAYGIPGRARLFEVIRCVEEVNRRRRFFAPRRMLTGKSSDAEELAAHKDFAVDYIVAPPRMALYMKYSTQIYQIYLRYVVPELIHVYSIDEVFIDVTNYLKYRNITAHQLARQIIQDILDETGITATAGIGTNLYLAKIAMDIVAKHMPADKDGVRIAELDEMSYRKNLWHHEPLTDFWRVGKGYAKKLQEVGLRTMGDIARCSLGQKSDYYNEDLLYKMFGVNAELLIDHAWGWEPCTLADIKAYQPENHSLGSGQVLQEPYTHEKARLVTWEMTDQLVLDLVAKQLVADQLILTVGYDIENMKNQAGHKAYRGPVHVDRYGRTVPKAAHGSINLGKYTSSRPPDAGENDGTLRQDHQSGPACAPHYDCSQPYHAGRRYPEKSTGS